MRQTFYILKLETQPWLLNWFFISHSFTYAEMGWINKGRSWSVSAPNTIYKVKGCIYLIWQ